MTKQEQEDFKRLEKQLLNAPTAEDVIAIRIEAFYKKFYDLVSQGRQMLIFSFGYKKASNGTLIPPTPNENN